MTNVLHSVVLRNYNIIITAAYDIKQRETFEIALLVSERVRNGNVAAYKCQMFLRLFRISCIFKDL